MSNVSNAAANAARIAVSRGVAWLDVNITGWERRINLDTLDMSTCEKCVLGQAVEDIVLSEISPDIFHGIKPDGYKAVTMSPLYGVNNISDWPETHGFEACFASDIDDVFETSFIKVGYAELEDAWLNIVKDRFNSGNFSDSD